MKTLFNVIFITLLVSSCSKDNGFTDAGKTKENEIKIKLNINEKEKNIFEMMEFSACSDDDFTLYDLAETYDSIVWKVSNQKGNFKVFEQSNNSTHFTSEWSNNFFFPAEYETYLIGYKDNNIIHSDTISINILNKKDFLGCNWAEIKGSIGHGVGYVNVLSENIEFYTHQDIHQGVPCVTLFIGNDNEKNEKILFDYVTSLYSAPDYDLENNEILIKNYHSLFEYKKENVSPTNIWITPKSKIVLLKCCNGDYYSYEVYAEPNK